MNTLLSALCLLVATGAAAQALPAFHDVGFPELRAEKSALPSPRHAAGDVIASDHLLIQAGKDVLFGYAKTDAEFADAAAYWTKALREAGVTPGAPTFADGMFTLPYKASDGRAIRGFLADPKQFPPKDEAGLRANMALIEKGVGAAGLTLVAARVVNVEALLPTYSVLYLTKPEENPDREVQLRVLKPGDDFDAGIYRGAGVDVLQTPESWMMVYLGPEVGYAGLWAQSPEDLAAKVAARRKLFAESGKRVIAQREFAIDDPTYKYGAALYFFQ